MKSILRKTSGTFGMIAADGGSSDDNAKDGAKDGANDGAEVASYFGIAPFGGVGDEWFNVVATNGDAFDEVRFFNGAFSSFNSYVDNISLSARSEGNRSSSRSWFSSTSRGIPP